MKARNTTPTMDEARKKDRFLCKCGTSQCRYDFCREYYPTECVCCGSKRPNPNSKAWKKHSEENPKKERILEEKRKIVKKILKEMPDNERYIFATPAIINGEFHMVLPSWKGMKNS